MAQIKYTGLTVGKIADFCRGDNYQDTVPDPGNPGQTMANPETKLAYMNRRGQEYFQAVIALGKKIERQAIRAAEDVTDATQSTIPLGDIT